MRITFLLTQSLDSPGGVGRYMPMAKCLSNLGHQVTIIALHHDYANLKKRVFVKDRVSIKYVSQMHVHKSGNTKTYYNPLIMIWISFLATVRLTWVSLRTPCDVLHVCKTQPMNGIAAWFTHLIKRVPIFLDSDDYEAGNNRFSSHWQQKLVALCEDWMPSFATGISAGNTFIAKRFHDLGYPDEQIVLVLNGVEKERFSILEQNDTEVKIRLLKQSLHLDQDVRIVVYIGSISLVSHAIDLLIQAFQQVIQKEPQARLLIIGAGEDIEYLQQMSRELHLEKQLFFLGRVQPEEIPFYFRIGEVSVDPRRNSIASESSLSLKLLESIASGTPCVTTDNGDRKLVIGEAGLSVIPDNIHALSNGILSILNDPEKSSHMHLMALQQRDENWWHRRIQEFTKLYDLL